MRFLFLLVFVLFMVLFLLCWERLRTCRLLLMPPVGKFRLYLAVAFAFFFFFSFNAILETTYNPLKRDVPMVHAIQQYVLIT